MNKQEQLIKFGTVLKHRRQALKLSLRDIEKLSNVSAALITKLENGKMANFPKSITIKQLSKALKFNNELFLLANILSETEEKLPLARYQSASKLFIYPSSIIDTIIATCIFSSISALSAATFAIFALAINPSSPNTTFTLTVARIIRITIVTIKAIRVIPFIHFLVPHNFSSKFFICNYYLLKK